MSINRLCHVSNGNDVLWHIIDLNAFYILLGSGLFKLLLIFHGFTGCYSNPAFYRNGKLHPSQLLRKKNLKKHSTAWLIFYLN